MFHLYGLVIGIAIAVGWSVAERIEPRVNKVAPLSIGLGLMGARAWYVIANWSYYSQDWLQVFALWNGGMSIWGGMVGGGMGLVIYQRIKISKNQRKEEIENILGAMVSGLPLSQAIGRIGNGINGEFSNIVWILPWWACEALLDLILFGIIWNLRADNNPPLQNKIRVFIYVLGYGLIRLVLQPYRL